MTQQSDNELMLRMARHLKSISAQAENSPMTLIEMKTKFQSLEKSSEQLRQTLCSKHDPAVYASRRKAMHCYRMAKERLDQVSSLRYVGERAPQPAPRTERQGWTYKLSCRYADFMERIGGKKTRSSTMLEGMAVTLALIEAYQAIANEELASQK